MLGVGHLLNHILRMRDEDDGFTEAFITERDVLLGDDEGAMITWREVLSEEQ